MKGLIYRDFCLVKKNWIPVFCISVGAVAYALASETINEDTFNQFQHSVITMSYMLILAVVFTVLILKDNKKQKNPAEI